MDDKQDANTADGGTKAKCPSLEELMAAAKPATAVVRPSAAVTQEELEAAFSDIAVSEVVVPLSNAATKRSIQRKTRLTLEEDARFLARVEQSGKGQSEFIREAILHKTIKSSVVPPIVETTCAAMLEYGSTQRKLAGMLVQTVKVNREFCILSPEQISTLNKAVKDFYHLGDRVTDMAEVFYGHF